MRGPVEHRRRLRRTLRQQRSGMDADQASQDSHRACERLMDLPEFRAASTILAYRATQGELDPASLLHGALSLGKAVALPRVAGPGKMLLLRWSEGQQLVTSPLGIEEPALGSPVMAPDQVDLVVVPAVALDQRGTRLGYGQGFYDRALAMLPRAYLVGLVYDFQVVSRIDRAEHDIPVHAIVTEQRHLVVSP